LAKRSGDARFAYDSYRRFIQMYSDVVLGVDHQHFEEILEDQRTRRGHELDTELTAEDWQHVIGRYKAKVEEETGKPFPQDPQEQLWGAIGAVFGPG
jgi:pyruvate,orthophosphate dikinase